MRFLRVAVACLLAGGVQGCTDPTAANYGTDGVLCANVEPVIACLDSWANNYNSQGAQMQVEVRDDSCTMNGRAGTGRGHGHQAQMLANGTEQTSVRVNWQSLTQQEAQAPAHTGLGLCFVPLRDVQLFMMARDRTRASNCRSPNASLAQVRASHA